jgi:ferredoxin
MEGGMWVATLLPRSWSRALRVLLHNLDQITRALRAPELPLLRVHHDLTPGTYAAPVRRAAAPASRPARRPSSLRDSPRRTGAPRHEVLFARSGVTLQVDEDHTLLEAGLESGLTLASACRMGLCGTCKARLLEGEVTMAEPNALSDAERASGYCLPCVSRPRGTIKLDA